MNWKAFDLKTPNMLLDSFWKGGGGHFCHIFSTQLCLSLLDPGYLLLLSNSTFCALQTSAEMTVEVARMFLISLKRICVGLRRAGLSCSLFLQHQSSHNLICVSAHSEGLRYFIMWATLHDELRCNFILADCVWTSSRSSGRLQLGGQNERSFHCETTAAVDHNKGQTVKNYTVLQDYSE